MLSIRLATIIVLKLGGQSNYFLKTCFFNIHFKAIFFLSFYILET